MTKTTRTPEDVIGDLQAGNVTLIMRNERYRNERDQALRQLEEIKRSAAGQFYRKVNKHRDEVIEALHKVSTELHRIYHAFDDYDQDGDRRYD